MALATAMVLVIDRRSSSDGAVARDPRPAPATLTATLPAPLSPTVPRSTSSPSGSAPAPSRERPAPADQRTVLVRPDGVANVRAGAGTGSTIIGTLSDGSEARARARNADGSWLLIELPAGTGWVSAGVVEVVGDPALLPVTDQPAATTTPTASVSPTATVGGSPAPVTGLPDLVLEDVAIGSAGRLRLIISNAGGPLTGRPVDVLGLDEGGNVLFREMTAALSLAAGAAVNVELNYRPAGPVALTVLLNSAGDFEERSTSNNRRRVSLTP